MHLLREKVSIQRKRYYLLSQAACSTRETNSRQGRSLPRGREKNRGTGTPAIGRHCMERRWMVGWSADVALLFVHLLSGSV